MSKRICDYLRKMSITYLNQQGLLYSVGRTTLEWEDSHNKNLGSIIITIQPLFEKPFILFSYSYGSNKEYVDYKVYLTTTPCNFGGERYWFLCPFTGCGRRVGTLYLGNKYFGCRHCYNLTYTSRSYGRGMRGLLRQIDAYKKIEKLEKEVKLQTYNDFPTKKYLKLMSLYSRINSVNI